MQDDRLTFTASTNIRVPNAIYSLLEIDAYHFGFGNEKRSNLSGMLNHLIPTLSEYRENLHFDLLARNDGDEELTRAVEECLYKRYNDSDFCDDVFKPVPLRVSKAKYEDFLRIHDLILPRYDIDFCSFVRSLLYEYLSKRLNERERLFRYRLLPNLKNAIKGQFVCTFVYNKETISFVPVSMETSRRNEQNIIIGVGESDDNFYAVPLAGVQAIVVNDGKEIEIADEDYLAIQDFFDGYENKEFD